MATDQDNMRPENFTTSSDGSAGPFIDVGTNTDATTFQIGQTDPLNLGDGPILNLGNIFPEGMNQDGLNAYLTLADYASELGVGGEMSLHVVIPEPSALVLALLGMLSLAARRRR